MISAPRHLMLVAPDFLGPFSARLYGLIQDRCAPRMFHSRVATNDPDRQRTVLYQIADETAVSGLICISMRPSQDVIERYTTMEVPVVLIDEHASGASSVSVDNVKGGELAGEHLLSLGHRRIALITGRTLRPGSANADARKEGFRHALEGTRARLLTVDCTEVDDYSEQDGRLWFAERPKDVTAVFCAAGDRCASGIVRAARLSGVRIPEELAIVAYDDAPIASQTVPPLTTIRQPLDLMAFEAHRLAVIEPHVSLAHPKRIVLRPEMVVRESTRETERKRAVAG